ncbi:MAG: TonB-dependent receptor [Candidatus Aminicenantes bacterium]|nr:TonB-dependent receptor [Candidatus Aminicenantes bacterium]
MNLKKTILTAFILCLAVTFSSAVDQYGVLAGVIKDTDGNALPGVEVTIRGTALQGIKTAVSNERGYFRIPLLPVGKDYEATFTLPGFKRVVWPKIVIELGKTFDLSITMETTAIEEEITVTAKSPVVDMKSSTSQVTLSKDLVETLANDRQYQTIMGLMPGAIDANNPFMFGASGSDNMYLFDGMDSTDPMTKTWSTAMNFDNFEEMQIVISGAPAEYGKGTGAVINVVTKAGGNRFSGIARITVSDVEWNPEAYGDRYFFSDATHFVTETRPSLNFGGPVIKDRLWFFASWERRNKWKPAAVYQSFEDWQDLTPTTGLKSYYTGHYLSGKLTFRPAARHTFMVQYAEDPIEIPQLYEYLGYNYVSPDSDLIRFQGGWNVNSELTSILGANTYVSLRYSLKRNELNNEPTKIAPCYYRGGVYYNGALSSYYTERFHDQIQLSLNHFAETSFGLHDLKIGAEMLDIRLGRYSMSYPANEYIRYDYDAAATPMYRYSYPERPRDQYTKNNYNRLWTFYLQDKWEVIPNLTLNIGLRAEMGQWKNHDKTTILDWGLFDMFAPRIGFAYNLKGTKFHGNWGRFYDLYGDWLIQNNQPDAFQYQYQYWRGAYYGLPTWTLIRTYTTGGASTSTYNPDIKPSFMDEMGIGVEHMLSDVISVGLDLMSRSWKQRIDDFDYGYDVEPYNNEDLDGIWHFDNAEFPDWGSQYKRYRAAIITFKKNLGSDKYQFMASYTLSDLKGYEGSDADGGWGDSPVQDYNAFGYLGNDIRHMIKFTGNYFLPFGFNLGTTFYWFSGTPYTETAGAFWTDSTYHTYRLDPQGESGRYPSTWRLDVRAEKRFTFFNRVNLSLYVDIFNLLNNQIEVARSNSIGNIILDSFQLGGNYTIETPNLNYGNYTQWYPPMSIFLGAKIEF